MTPAALAKFATSSVDDIDVEIGARIRKVTAGNASASDISEVSSLVRKRAEAMMPGVFATREEAVAARRSDTKRK